MKTKKCTKCKKIKLVEKFNTDKKSKDGFFIYCKECLRIVQRQYERSPKGKENRRRKYEKQVEKGVFLYGTSAISRLKLKAQKELTEVTITKDQLESWWKKKQDKCAYCKTTKEDYLKIREFLINYDGNKYEIIKFKRLFASEKHQKIENMVIERVDKFDTYNYHNIVKCCWICSNIKGVFIEPTDMEKIASKIIKSLMNEIEYEQKEYE